MAWLEIFNFLHFVGLAFGLGGATIASIISAKADKDAEVGKVSMKILPSIIKFIWFGIILLIISGIAISSFIKWPINTNLLIIKHVFVAWIVIIGIIIGVKSKKIAILIPKGKEKPSYLFLKTKKQIKGLSIINLILWYLVTLLSAFV